jgi:hypothetical protein
MTSQQYGGGAVDERCICTLDDALMHQIKPLECLFETEASTKILTYKNGSTMFGSLPCDVFIHSFIHFRFIDLK